MAKTRRQIAFCKTCHWPILSSRGYLLEEKHYGSDTREPRKSSKIPRGYCSECGIPEKVDTVDNQVEPEEPVLPPCKHCGRIPECKYDYPNDEFFVACECLQEGARRDSEEDAALAWANNEFSRKPGVVVLGVSL